MVSQYNIRLVVLVSLLKFVSILSAMLTQQISHPSLPLPSPPHCLTFARFQLLLLLLRRLQATTLNSNNVPHIYCSGRSHAVATAPPASSCSFSLGFSFSRTTAFALCSCRAVAEWPPVSVRVSPLVFGLQNEFSNNQACPASRGRRSLRRLLRPRRRVFRRIYCQHHALSIAAFSSLHTKG